MDLLNELQIKLQSLNVSLKELRKSGTNYAQKEKEYKIVLRQECLKLRDSKMAIGMIDKVCYGIPEVANKRFERDVAETIYKANQESINTLKLEIRIIENQISREWSSGNDNM